jgi:peptidoglycan-associated lipoprotein
MTKYLTVAFLALFALAGCSSSHKGGAMHSGVENSLMNDFEKNVGDRVFFAFDSSELNAHSKEQLKKQLTWLASHPHVKVTVEGHCDERGTREYNLALGERRAAEVAKFMEHHGLDKVRVETISYGKEKPAVIGNDEHAWSQNRRGVTALRY